MDKFKENNELKDKIICVNKNEEAWNKETYNAWIKRFGTVEEAAERIKVMPEKRLNILLDKFGEVKGKKIFNLMGSNGNKAVALALLGADVTVVDFSEGNKRYALDLAKACGVEIKYILSDVLNMPAEIIKGDYDIVFAEMGILHYFSDLNPFIKVMSDLLKEGGKAVIRDFHPVSTKLITSRGTTAKVRKHKVTGDYFDTSLEEKEVAYSKYLDEGEVEKVYLRKWNLGEIITAVASNGLKIESLTEEPNLSGDTFDKGIPKTFTVVAKK